MFTKIILFWPINRVTKRPFMELQQVIDYCSAKPGTTTEFPFDDTTMVFKVMGKMFGLINIDGPPYRLNLKGDPAYAAACRQKYQSVQPGYHMNKRHWNTIELDGDVPEGQLLEWIDDSYDLVVAGMKNSDREKLKFYMNDKFRN